MNPTDDGLLQGGMRTSRPDLPHIIEIDGYLDLPRIPCRRNAAERFPRQQPRAISLVDGRCVRLPKMMHSTPFQLSLWWKMFINRG